MSTLDPRPPSTTARRDPWLETLLMLVLAPVTLYLAVRAGVVLLNGSMALVDGASANERDPIISGDTAHVAGLVAAIGAFALTAWGRLSVIDPAPRPTIVDARHLPAFPHLDDLPSEFHVVHGLTVTDAQDVIDHVVVGPTGVFAIVAREYPCDVVVKSGHALVNGRPVDGIADRASHLAAGLSRTIGQPVLPVVCVLRSGVRVDAVMGKPYVGGVRFCAAGKLARTITKGERILDLRDVDRIDATLVGS